uniref:Uncharacterized protein n=1 Tax=Oryza punctata TaxID=4537 RepID=A0A0E0KA14_ORYPU
MWSPRGANSSHQKYRALYYPGNLVLAVSREKEQGVLVLFHYWVWKYVARARGAKQALPRPSARLDLHGRNSQVTSLAKSAQIFFPKLQLADECLVIVFHN